MNDKGCCHLQTNIWDLWLNTKGHLGKGGIGLEEFTGYILELIPSITTRIERLYRKSDSHRIKVLPTP